MDSSTAPLVGIGMMVFVALTMVALGARERRAHREEIGFFKAHGWEEAYRFPRHYWWHRETNRAIAFGDYMRDRKGVLRLVEKAEHAAKKR